MGNIPQDPLRQHSPLQCWPRNRITTSPGPTDQLAFAKDTKPQTSGLLGASFLPGHQKDPI